MEETVIRSQYLASLAMLEQAIIKCPESMWDDPDKKNRFWHVAYHALFFTHLYLSGSEKAFVPWSKHQEAFASLEVPAGEPGEGQPPPAPYRKEELLEYLMLCQGLVKELVPALDLAAESGFYWLPFNKLELQFYNIRHLQQHTGELCERLGTEANIDVDWVGMEPPSAA
jgi:hypothetical protein